MGEFPLRETFVSREISGKIGASLGFGTQGRAGLRRYLSS